MTSSIRFRKRDLATAIALCAGIGASAHAEFSLEQQLTDSLAGTTAATKGERVHESASGHWVLSRDADNPGLNCVLTFASAKSKGTSFSFFGPKPTVPFGMLAYGGPSIPDTPRITETRAEMLFEGEKPAVVRAFHAPRQDGKGFVLVPTKDIKSSIDPINDVENNMGLKLNGAAVFKLDYDGGKTARAAMLDCLDGKTGKK